MRPLHSDFSSPTHVYTAKRNYSKTPISAKVKFLVSRSGAHFYWIILWFNYGPLRRNVCSIGQIRPTLQLHVEGSTSPWPHWYPLLSIRSGRYRSNQWVYIAMNSLYSHLTFVRQNIGKHCEIVQPLSLMLLQERVSTAFLTGLPQINYLIEAHYT